MEVWNPGQFPYVTPNMSSSYVSKLSRLEQQNWAVFFCPLNQCHIYTKTRQSFPQSPPKAKEAKFLGLTFDHRLTW